jgi:competence protein ComEC
LRRLPPLGLVASLRFALEQRRFFTLLPVAVIAGLVAYVIMPGEPSLLLLAGVGVALVIVLVASLRRIGLLRAAVLAAAFWCGFALLAIHGALFGTAMLARPAYGDFTMVVDTVISESEDGQRVLVSNIVAAPGSRGVPMRRARLFLRQAPSLAPGDTIALKVRFYSVPGPALPNGYDGQFTGYFDGIGAYGAGIGPVTVMRDGDGYDPVRFIEGIRRGIAQRIDAVLAQPSAGIARAVINGDQSAVTDASRDTMAAAGLAHVLSISGLHLTLVAGGVFFVLRLVFALVLPARLPAKPLAALTAIAAAVLYYGISGGNVAALRSTVMIVLVFGAVIAGRRAITMRNVAIAALLVVVTDPSSVFGPSFQLSFSAVVALVGAYESLPRRRERRGVLGHVGAHFGGVIVTSVVAGVATLLFSIYHFQQTSPLGVLGNLAALPLVGFIMMPAALVGVLAMPFGLERLPLLVMGWSVDRMLDIAGLIATLGEGLKASPLLTPMALVIGLAALGWFAFLPNRWRLAGPVLAVPLVVLLALDKPPDVIVSDTTQAVAVRGEEGLALAAGRPGSFAVTVWGDTYGAPLAPISAEERHCDSMGCIVASPAGFTLSLVNEADAFAEDCANADLVVTRSYAPSYCRKETTVIDAGDLYRRGVHALYWQGGGFAIRPAISDPNRPWRVSPR